MSARFLRRVHGDLKESTNCAGVRTAPPPARFVTEKVELCLWEKPLVGRVSLIFVHPSVSFPFVVSGVSCLVYRNTVVWESLMEIM